MEMGIWCLTITGLQKNHNIYIHFTKVCQNMQLKNINLNLSQTSIYTNIFKLIFVWFIQTYVHFMQALQIAKNHSKLQQVV